MNDEQIKILNEKGLLNEDNEEENNFPETCPRTSSNDFKQIYELLKSKKFEEANQLIKNYLVEKPKQKPNLNKFLNRLNLTIEKLENLASNENNNVENNSVSNIVIKYVFDKV